MAIYLFSYDCVHFLYSIIVDPSVENNSGDKSVLGKFTEFLPTIKFSDITLRHYSQINAFKVLEFACLH